GHFQTLLEGIVSNPEQKISELPLLTEWERQQLVAWNNTATDYPQNACIHQLFEEQVERSPDAIALVFEDQQLTYKELNQRANQLAHYLGKLGVTAEIMVGICVERSLEMVVGLLGILKAGGAYVPLDPAYPPERLALMLEDAQVPVLLTQRRLVESLPKHQARVVCLDTDWEIIERQSEENPECSLTSENLAYVIYTSGSTGKPKGVLVGHRGLCNLAIAQIQIFDVQPNSRVLQFASLSFDVATSDWVIALCSGATLCIAINNALLAGSDLIEVLRDRAITHIELPVAVLGVVPFEELSTLQTIIVGGETVSVDVVAKWAPGRRFFNAYGPTESTVCATIAECTDSQEPPSIGRPIANTQVYLLDAHLQLVPIGIPGEIYIGGAGLARGYLNRPELTAERFIPNPFSNEPGSRLYKTGDLARYLPDGNIEFLGRIDHQVKIRGFRIELGEIEAVLSQHPDVQESLVISRSDVSGNQRLVAYIISNLGLEHTDFGSWRNFLKQKLPDYMVPSSFVFLPNFPLTPNGKVDRKALPEPEAINPELSATYVAPQTEIEQNIATVWQQLLHLEKVGVDDNFFDLGGHSLLMAQAHSQLREVVDRDVSIVEMFKYPTIRSLAKYLSEEPEEQSSVGSSQERIKKQKDAMNRQKQKQALKGKNKNR
ncbi:MAG: amino acid adenylation domain-containing protein, partial [Microcoleus sp. PH2017_04_SCI_O_A]|nr:amino acid adenylation domain-containing protein [Microcoleus sp. PH2017_04_SCI_O_A]